MRKIPTDLFCFFLSYFLCVGLHQGEAHHDQNQKEWTLTLWGPFRRVCCPRPPVHDMQSLTAIERKADESQPILIQWERVHVYETVRTPNFWTELGDCVLWNTQTPIGCQPQPQIFQTDQMSSIYNIFKIKPSQNKATWKSMAVTWPARLLDNYRTPVRMHCSGDQKH